MSGALVAKELNLVGQQFGNYKILSELGRGGMAIVYKADELSLNRVVALKVMSPKISEDEEMIKRFQREAQAAAKLSHPNIVHVYSMGEIQGVHYFTMEYVKGRTLRQIRKQGPLPLPRAIGVMIEVAQALDEAHKAGLVHRDIKPSNIMIDAANGRVKVTDFGLARMVEPTTQLTVDGTFLGTPEYMSPEQCEAKPVDGRTDIYSLGVTFYELLTGKIPFTAETPASMIVKIMKGEMIPIRQVDPSIPPQVEEVIQKMLSFDRDKRYRDAAELAAILEKLRAQVSVSDRATQVSTVRRGDAAKKPDRLVLGIAAVLVLALVGAGILLAIQYGSPRVQGAVTAVSEPVAAGTKNEAPGETGKAAAPAAVIPAVVPAGSNAAPAAVAPVKEAVVEVAAVKPSPAVAKETSVTPRETPAVPKETVAPPREVLVAAKDVPVAPKETPEPAKPAASGPASNSVMVVTTGDSEKGDLLSSYVESGLPKGQFDVVDGSTAQGKKAAEVARYTVTLKATKMGTRTLQFHGSYEDLQSYTLTLKMIQSDSGKVVAGPVSRKVEYTALNADANLKEAVQDLVSDLKKALPASP
jgi:tRNA A-37 threonylcarbamoyl transferase component Bud32